MNRVPIVERGRGQAFPDFERCPPRDIAADDRHSVKPPGIVAEPACGDPRCISTGKIASQGKRLGRRAVRELPHALPIAGIANTQRVVSHQYGGKSERAGPLCTPSGEATLRIGGALESSGCTRICGLTVDELEVFLSSDLSIAE
jgi:hypothetical protein